MKKIYTPLLLLFLFASCSPHLVTKGIQDKTSNYIVTAGGKHIDAASVEVTKDAVSAGSATYTLYSISAIKQGQAYYGVKDGQLYDGVYYGKLMLLRRYSGMTYDMNTHLSRASYRFYLQKEGQPDIVDLTNNNLIDYVQDNPLALQKARAAKIYTNVCYISGFTAIAGLACVFLPYSSRVRTPAVTAGLIALPTFIITMPIAGHKKFKAINIYNR